MKIHGLQKVTLLDFPGEVACTVFTGGCNLRCPFCHNASLVLPEAFPEAVDEEALFAFLLSGAVPFEFRTTVVRPLHQAEDFEAIGRWIRGDEEYYLQTFTDSGELLDGAGLGPWDGASMEKFAETARAYVPHTYLRGI